MGASGSRAAQSILLRIAHQDAGIERGGREGAWGAQREGWCDGDREGACRGREEELQKALDRERSKAFVTEYELSELRKAVNEERGRRASAEEQAAAWKAAWELSEQGLHAEMECAALRLEVERSKQQENVQSVVEKERAQVEQYF